MNIITRFLYNNFVPKFLRHFRAKYFCGMTPSMTFRKHQFHFITKWAKKYQTYTCRGCGRCLAKGYDYK